MRPTVENFLASFCSRYLKAQHNRSQNLFFKGLTIPNTGARRLRRGRIPQSVRKKLCECLGIDPRREPHRADSAMTSLEGDLGLQTDPARAARIVASLEAIKRITPELARLILPDAHNDVIRELDMPDVANGTAWQMLSDMYFTANVAIQRLRAKPRPRHRVTEIGDASGTVGDALGMLFSTIRGEPDTGDPARIAEYNASKRQFIETCGRYLPGPPSRRRRWATEIFVAKGRVSKD
jgi:hypothetical protein